jgi:hypothetical protein
LVSKAKPLKELPASTASYLIDLGDTIVKIVGDWGDKRDDGAMYSELQKILSEAVDFSKLIRTQRANWSVRFPTYPGQFPKKRLSNEPNFVGV